MLRHARRRPPPADMPDGSPFGHCCRGLPRRHQAKASWPSSSICMPANWSATTSWSRCCNGLFGLTLSERAIANMLARAAKPFAVAGEAIAAEVRAAPSSPATRLRHVCKEKPIAVAACCGGNKPCGNGCSAARQPSLMSSRPVVARRWLRPSWLRRSPRYGSPTGLRHCRRGLSRRQQAWGGHAEQHQFCLAHLRRDAHRSRVKMLRQAHRRRCGCQGPIKHISENIARVKHGRS